MQYNVKQELKNILVSSDVMKQISIDLCFLPKVDEFKHVVICIDYFFNSHRKPNQLVTNQHQQLVNCCISLSVKIDVLLHRLPIKANNSRTKYRINCMRCLVPNDRLHQRIIHNPIV